VSLQEYQELKGIRRARQVTVTYGDFSWIGPRFNNHVEVYLKVLGNLYTYKLNCQNGVLYTIDADGNPKRRSVFVVSDEELKKFQ
jgi:hypothetical protein